MIAYDASQWHGLFAVGADSSATLLGLLFVAVSLNLKQILDVPSLPPLAARSLGVLLLRGRAWPSAIWRPRRSEGSPFFGPVRRLRARESSSRTSAATDQSRQGGDVSADQSCRLLVDLAGAEIRVAQLKLPKSRRRGDRVNLVIAMVVEGNVDK